MASLFASRMFFDAGKSGWGVPTPGFGYLNCLNVVNGPDRMSMDFVMSSFRYILVVPPPKIIWCRGCRLVFWS